MTDDDMKTKTIDELYEIMAGAKAKQEELERQFKISIVESLMRIEDELSHIRYGEGQAYATAMMQRAQK